jgi:hypothetical protein
MLRAVISGVDDRNAIRRAVLFWDGAGWYAAGCRWDPVLRESYLIIQCMSRDRDAYDKAAREARSWFLGSPFWAETPEEALRPYKEVGRVIYDDHSEVY